MSPGEGGVVDGPSDEQPDGHPDEQPPVFCSVVGPHVLEVLARSEDPAVSGPAWRALETDAFQRARRQLISETEAHVGDARPAGDPGVPYRTVRDAGRGPGENAAVVRTEGGAPGRDAAANRAYAGLGATFDLIHGVYGWDSLDGAGLPLEATVHVNEGYSNAFWNGERLLFGDGDGEIFGDFTVPLDVIGHELAHGIVQFTAGLSYFGQPGAIHESLADVFGSLVKQYALGQTADEADWLIGAGLLRPQVTGHSLRSLKAPGTAYDDDRLGRDPQPATMDDYVRTSRDNGGVHINSGILNHAFYLFASALGGFAWERAGQVWFDALTGGRLGSRALFYDFAGLTLSSARSRYGDGDELEAVRKAWEQVGVRADGSGGSGGPGGGRRSVPRPRPARLPAGGPPRRTPAPVESLTEAFREELERRWRHNGQLGSSDGELDEEAVHVIGADAAALALSNVSWHLALGECADADTAASGLDRSREDVVRGVESGRLVGLSGKYEVFLPLWQFANRRPQDGLDDKLVRVLEVFRTGLGQDFSPELVLLWAATRQPELDNREPRTVLTEVTVEELLGSARATVTGLVS